MRVMGPNATQRMELYDVRSSIMVMKMRLYCCTLFRNG